MKYNTNFNKLDKSSIIKKYIYYFGINNSMKTSKQSKLEQVSLILEEQSFL